MITVGFPVFEREEASRKLLDSIPDYVEEVIIADNSENQLSQNLSDNYPFNITRLYLEYDIGIGKCRNSIADNCKTEYLFVCDNDMRIQDKNDLITLQKILENEPHLGGIAGILKEGNTLRSGGTNLHTEKLIGGKTILVRGNMTNDQTVIESNNYCYIEFDFIPQSCLFRTKVFDTYNYDIRLNLHEHTDFFYSHKQVGSWKFAITPNVIVYHDHGYYPEYRKKRTKRYNQQNGKIRKDILKEKWGVDGIVTGNKVNWFTSHRSNKEKLFDVLRQKTPGFIWIPTREILRKIT